jgi:hypothetical protein
MSPLKMETRKRRGRYETALHEIAERVQRQIALEEHQRRNGLTVAEIDFGRADAYREIAFIAMKTLGQTLRLH